MKKSSPRPFSNFVQRRPDESENPMNRFLTENGLVVPEFPLALTCKACGKTYGEAAWRSLHVLERIEPEVRRLVSKWPEGLRVEVRRCSGCGRTIAAKRPRE